MQSPVHCESLNDGITRDSVVRQLAVVTGFYEILDSLRE